MYTAFKDTTDSWKRTRPTLTSAGRSQKRKDFALMMVSMSIVFFSLMGVFIATTHLTTAETEYATKIADIRYKNITIHK